MAAKQQQRGAKGRKVWVVDFWLHYPDGTSTRIREDSPMQTRRGTEQYERDRRDELLEAFNQPPEEEKPPPPTLADFEEEFLDYCEAHNKPSELAKKRQVFRKHLLPTFGHLRLDEIDAKVIDQWIASQRKTASPKTVNNRRGVLYRALRQAEAWEMIASVPKTKALPVPDQDFDWLSFEELERLLEQADEWRPLILFAARTGLRRGELLALEWGDLDLKAATVRVNKSSWDGELGATKTGRNRTVPLSPETIEAIRRLSSRFAKEAVWCDSEGHRLSVPQIEWALDRTWTRAGLRRIGWHVLRHTFASHLAIRGVPIRTISELMGHRTLQMTMRYAHLSPDVGRDAVAVLDRAAPNGIQEESHG